MSQSSATETSVEFGSDTLVMNAKIYRAHKRIVDAACAAKYDNVDDAIAALNEVVATLTSQVAEGAGYTPDRALGFGSDNAAQIAEKVLGLGTSDATARKAFAEMGK